MMDTHSLSVLELEQRKRRARLRRQALVDKGYGTYVLFGISPHRTIACCCCGTQSMNISDIASRFCAFCSEFHTEWNMDGPT